jgi:DNA modification methylase
MPPSVTILDGHALDRLVELPDNSVHCCVTSPPYWGLRDYGLPPLDWPAVRYSPLPGLGPITLPAWSGSLGLEPTIELFIGHTVAIFREIRRVLRKDATCWVNLGDSYAGGGNGGGGSFAKDGIRAAKPGSDKNVAARTGSRGVTVKGKRIERGSGRWGGGDVCARDLKPKDLCGIPWRVAFALQADGWWLRRDNIWHKTNPMPESTPDRPTTAHEYLFLLTKRGHYYYDRHAIQERIAVTTAVRMSQDLDAQAGSARANGGTRPNRPMKAVGSRVPSGWDTREGHSSNAQIGRYSFARKTKNTAGDHGQKPQFRPERPNIDYVGRRNKRSVWTIPTAPFKGAHFATYPPKLIEPCILAGTSAHGCCSQCGAPYKRLIINGEPDLEWQRKSGGDRNGQYHGHNTKDYLKHKAQPASTVKARILAGMLEKKTVAWQPTCKCPDPVVIPCTVLDPFGGSGTTGVVAHQHGRRAILIELNPAYADMARKRCDFPVQPSLAL